MLRLLGRRRSHILATSNTDQVIFGISLPSDTVVNRIRADVHLAGTSDRTAIEGVWYGCEGWILPILDPEDNASFDVIWNQLVPKDSDVQALDLDTGAQDTTGFFEPGEVDWSQLLDVGLRPQRIFQRLRMLSYATAQRPHTASDIPLWRPSDSFRIDLNRRFVVRQPSVLLFAMGVPLGDDTTSTVETALSEVEWSQVKYMEHVLERAQMDLLGLTETGAETPWEEATDLLQAHLEPDMFEETAGAWAAWSCNVFTDALIDHSVVGTLGKMTISTGR